MFATNSADTKEAKEGEEFNTSDFIFHHIQDSYGFHVAGDFSIPLPVILWTDNGLVTFMSSEFHHDYDGKVVVEKKVNEIPKATVYLLDGDPAAADDAGLAVRSPHGVRVHPVRHRGADVPRLRLP